MNLLKNFAAASMMIALAVAGSPSFAAENISTPPASVSQNAAPNQKPIMIIRFNKEDVLYKSSVEKMIRKALSMKPSASFNVVSLVPASPKQALEIADHNGRKIVEAVAAAGANAERIKLVMQKDSTITFNEIHIVAY